MLRMATVTIYPSCNWRYLFGFNNQNVFGHRILQFSCLHILPTVHLHFVPTCRIIFLSFSLMIAIIICLSYFCFVHLRGLFYPWENNSNDWYVQKRTHFIKEDFLSWEIHMPNDLWWSLLCEFWEKHFEFFSCSISSK